MNQNWRWPNIHVQWINCARVRFPATEEHPAGNVSPKPNCMQAPRCRSEHLLRCHSADTYKQIFTYDEQPNLPPTIRPSLRSSFATGIQRCFESGVLVEKQPKPLAQLLCTPSGQADTTTSWRPHNSTSCSTWRAFHWIMLRRPNLTSASAVALHRTLLNAEFHHAEWANKRRLEREWFAPPDKHIQQYLQPKPAKLNAGRVENGIARFGRKRLALASIGQRKDRVSEIWRVRKCSDVCWEIF